MTDYEWELQQLRRDAFWIVGSVLGFWIGVGLGATLMLHR